MPHPNDRDNAINESILSRLSSEQGEQVDYHGLRERVRRGDLGDLDRDATWEVLSDAAEGFDYDISEGHAADRGTEGQDKADSARLSGLLGEFEKKFGTPDHWKWGPIGTPGYDYDEGMMNTPGDYHDHPGDVDRDDWENINRMVNYAHDDSEMEDLIQSTLLTKEELINRLSSMSMSGEFTDDEVSGFARELRELDAHEDADQIEKMNRTPPQSMSASPTIDFDDLPRESGPPSSLTSAISDYQASQPIVPDVGMDKSMEYRGAPSMSMPIRKSGRGRMY